MSTSSELFAIAAHLHVLLRRKTGRVTDTEWMTSNAEYAREIVRYTRDKARSEGHADLLPLADKLEAAINAMGATPRRSLLEVAADTLRPSAAPATGPDSDPRYVGGLR